MKLYHATKKENAASILTEGLKIEKTTEGVNFLADTWQTAVMFLLHYGVSNITVFEFDLPDDFPLEISQDNNPIYFPGTSYYTFENVNRKYISNISDYITENSLDNVEAVHISDEPEEMEFLQ